MVNVGTMGPFPLYVTACARLVRPSIRGPEAAPTAPSNANRGCIGPNSKGSAMVDGSPSLYRAEIGSGGWESCHSLTLRRPLGVCRDRTPSGIQADGP